VIFAELSEIRGALGLRLLLPEWGTIDVAAALLSVAALVAILRFRAGVVPVLLLSALAGIVLRLV
jgi:chromate transporter